MQLITLICSTCKTNVEIMREETPENFVCSPCVLKDSMKGMKGVVLDGAPAGFVHGGVSNKAGFSSGKTFSGHGKP